MRCAFEGHFNDLLIIGFAIVVANVILFCISTHATFTFVRALNPRAMYRAVQQVLARRAAWRLVRSTM